jgi:hypothetical protein
LFNDRHLFEQFGLILIERDSRDGMASKMTLVFLISVTVTLLVVSYFLLKQEHTEGFQSTSYSVKDLDIRTCPSFASEIQTARGNTDCCQGDMVDGKCNGTTFCTKSPSYAGVPACDEKWREYFTTKGTDFCPPTMPHYFEDVINPSAIKGCSAGPITKDGKMPKDATAKQCKVYPSEEDNLSKIDSCYLEKQRAKIQCPVVNGQSPAADLYSEQNQSEQNQFVAFRCSYPFELGMPQFCFEKKSVYNYLSKIFGPNWVTTGRVRDVDSILCENYIAQRESARDRASKLQAEQRAREAAEANAKAAQDAKAKAEAELKKKLEDASRLQQQLDEANRQLQTCKK